MYNSVAYNFCTFRLHLTLSESSLRLNSPMASLVRSYFLCTSLKARSAARKSSFTCVRKDSKLLQISYRGERQVSDWVGLT